MCLGQLSVQQRLVQAGLQRRLAFSAQIAVSRVEIIEARVQKCVDHFRRLCQTDPAVLHRKAHEAEAEVLFDMFHIGASSFMFCLYFNGREGFHQAPFSGTQNGSPRTWGCRLLLYYRFCIETQAIHLDGWMLKYS